jgi:hypothetical protein
MISSFKFEGKYKAHQFERIHKAVIAEMDKKV